MEQEIDLGKARITPDTELTAGEYTTLTFVYTAGHCIDDSGYIKIAFRFAGDFGTPQFDRSEAANYCTVSTTGDCRIEPRWDPKGNRRPWGKALYLKVRGGFLDKGEEVTVVFGDTSKASPGWQVQTFAEGTFEFKTYVDPFATYRFKELTQSPVVPIVADKPASMVLIAPSLVEPGTEFSYFTRLHDRWGNIVEPAAKHDHPGFSEEGWQEITERDGKTGFEALSNPVLVQTQKAGDPSPGYWWGDLHGQSEETIGTNTIDEYFTYARDYSKVDVAAHQGNDFQITDEFWEKINKTAASFNKPGSFVTFPGYEWSGNTPLGGDRNVYFKEEGGEVNHSHHDLLPDTYSKYPPAPTADLLFQCLRKSRATTPEGPKPFVFAHVGGRYADITMHDEKIETAMEVHSAWGTFEWLITDALKKGYRIGICGASDGHKGRPGASYPGVGKFGSLGGLTCFLTEKLDRDHIYEAIKKRHFYATSGHRPVLSVEVENLQGGPGSSGIMGDIIETESSEVTLRVRVIGTANLEAITIFNGTEIVESRKPYTADDLGNRVKLVWAGAEVRGRDRMSNWDGSLAVRGNGIRNITPINFWNLLQQIKQTAVDSLEWESVTTGGLAGMILDLEEGNKGELEITWKDGGKKEPVRVGVLQVDLEPRVYSYGGLEKKLELYRLPPRDAFYREMDFTVKVKDLKTGDNPLYIRAAQEDGHLAWSSPVYVVR